MIVDKNSKIKYPIFKNPSILGILSRFNILPGVGELTIYDCAQINGVSIDLLIAIINTYLNQNYTFKPSEYNILLDDIIEYLEKTDDYYVNVQIPNIDRHFVLLLKNQPLQQSKNDSSNLIMLNKFYLEVRTELINFIANDKNCLFPKLRSGDFSGIEEMIANECVLQDKINDLLSFFIVHLKGEYDSNLVLAVLSAIMVLERDIKQNNQIRDKILRASLLGVSNQSNV